jgi:hypothetical protein
MADIMLSRMIGHGPEISWLGFLLHITGICA